jgi:U4/U6.U5 tri-snRNP component SNU23
LIKKPVPDHRRKWDKDEYEKIAAARLEEEEKKALERELSREKPVKRELLQPREYKVIIVSDRWTNACQTFFNL